LKGEIKMADRDEFGSFVIGFLVGAVTGAVVSLLFAPQTGEETRVMIKERGIELADKANEAAQSVSKDVGELASSAKTSADELAKKGQAVFEDSKTKVTVAVQSVVKPTKSEAEV
jgi:gas vesicle protein